MGEGEAGEARAQPQPHSLLCPLSWRLQEPLGVARGQLKACRRRTIALAAGEGRESAEKGTFLIPYCERRLLEY